MSGGHREKKEKKGKKRRNGRRSAAAQFEIQTPVCPFSSSSGQKPPASLLYRAGEIESGAWDGAKISLFSGQGYGRSHWE